jgi:uncharacterized membrane protein
MREWLVSLTEPVSVVLDGLALLMIVIGTIDVLVRGLPVMIGSPTGHLRRDIWLRYSRWLVAALTFQLAADIIETSIGTSWSDVGRLGAIAVIRTFLDYFLGHEVSERRELQHPSEPSAPNTDGRH